MVRLLSASSGLYRSRLASSPRRHTAIRQSPPLVRRASFGGESNQQSKHSPGYVVLGLATVVGSLALGSITSFDLFQIPAQKPMSRWRESHGSPVSGRMRYADKATMIKPRS